MPHPCRIVKIILLKKLPFCNKSRIQTFLLSICTKK